MAANTGLEFLLELLQVDSDTVKPASTVTDTLTTSVELCNRPEKDGLINMVEGKYREAISYFGASLLLDSSVDNSSKTLIRFLRGLCWMHIGDYKLAETDIDYVAQKDDITGKLCNALLFYYEKGDAKQCQTIMQQILGGYDDKRRQSIYFLCGIAVEAFGDEMSALKVLDKCVTWQFAKLGIERIEHDIDKKIDDLLEHGISSWVMFKYEKYLSMKGKRPKCSLKMERPDLKEHAQDNVEKLMVKIMRGMELALQAYVSSKSEVGVESQLSLEDVSNEKEFIEYATTLFKTLPFEKIKHSDLIVKTTKGDVLEWINGLCMFASSMERDGFPVV